MNKNFLKRNNGFVFAEAVLAGFILMIMSGVVIALVFNIYSSKLSLHRTAMATNYCVEILEQVKILNYDDEKLEPAEKDIEELFGITLADNYKATIKIENYNDLLTNQDKLDVIKIVNLNIEYQDGELTKNIEMRTLKIRK